MGKQFTNKLKQYRGTHVWKKEVKNMLSESHLRISIIIQIKTKFSWFLVNLPRFSA
jgi:hypothetical protein